MTTETVKPLPYPGHTTWEAQKNMESKGSYWWTPDTMRFFGTRVGSEFYGPGGLYFVTSEAHPHPLERWPAKVRKYTVRKYNPESNDIETIGEFGGYRTASPARTEARRLSRGGTPDHPHIQPHGVGNVSRSATHAHGIKAIEKPQKPTSPKPKRWSLSLAFTTS